MNEYSLDMPRHGGSDSGFHLNSTVRMDIPGNRKFIPSLRSELIIGEGISMNTRSSWDRRGLTAKWITLQDFVTLLDSDLDNNSRHRSTNRSWVIGGSLPRDGFYGRVLVLYGDSSDLRFVSTYPENTPATRIEVYTSPLTSNQTSR